MRYLINAANLHVGGGVQVATSVISEFFEGDKNYPHLDIFASSEVARNFYTLVEAAQEFDRFNTLNVRGFNFFSISARQAFDQFDKVFTIFGPLYRWRPRFRSVVGFAQPWIIYPNNECYAQLPFWKRLKVRLKFHIQGMFFKRADALVVELEHVKEGLIRELGIPAERIHVVPNCLGSIYTKEEAWQAVSVAEVDCDLRLGFVGRNYHHKNTAIFTDIVEILRERHKIDAKFFVTFTPEEWSACTSEFRDVCINVGPLTVAQCPSFYRSLDAVVFPSLLECFSATPLEAMAMEKPLFASDRPFNRDVCGEHAYYFDPMSPETAARQIAEIFCGPGPDATALRAARDHAIAFASPKDRALKYLSLLCGNPVEEV